MARREVGARVLVVRQHLPSGGRVWQEGFVAVDLPDGDYLVQVEKNVPDGIVPLIIKVKSEDMQ